MIGLFDAGVGGLSVLNALHTVLPRHRIGYIADTGRFPYAPRPLDEKLLFSLQDTDFLVDTGATVIVIACNTITCIAGEAIRKRVDMPVFDVISAGAESAVATSKNKKIGVFGSMVTGTSPAYQDAVSKIDNEAQVKLLPSQIMVYLVEEGAARWPEIRPLVKHILKPLIESDIDVLVLGCTHFPFFIDAVRDAIGPDIQIVDPGVAVAEQVKCYFASHPEKSTVSEQVAKPTFYVSGPIDRFISIVEQYHGIIDPDQVVKLEWETILASKQLKP